VEESYAIRIYPLMGSWICTVTRICNYGESEHRTTNLYTIDRSTLDVPDAAHLIGELYRLVSETTP
jgi:hypothetical protein